jgi:tRNA uridine 5-carboxymethylaminomethyl modification enzyme
LFAGINAALQCRAMGLGEGNLASSARSAAGSISYTGDKWLPGRDEAYLGVLVDDLITKGVTEPYRMFTSRAEYRLQLREDNADARLTEQGRALGLVDDARWQAFNKKRDAVSRETERLKSIWVNPNILPAAEAERVLGKAISHEHNLADLLRRPDVSYDSLMGLQTLGKDQSKDPAKEPVLAARFASPDVSRETAPEVVEQVEIAIKYAGYINGQRDEIARAAYYEHLRLPAELDYAQVGSLSIEARQKLGKHQPETLGMASRISGITPATISLLLVHLKKGKFRGFDKPAVAADSDRLAA